jgi:uncharacterized DUF497 family protein
MFEFDPAKSQSNKQKHGIDFEEAQALWDDPDGIGAEASSIVETRQLVGGRVGDLMWCAVYTMRGGAIRIISVRRARKNEVEAYEQHRERREKDDRT